MRRTPEVERRRLQRDAALQMIYRARSLVTMDGPPIDNGAVAVAGDRIADTGRFDEIRARNAGEVIDLGEVALLPGLINAHCHLDYTMLCSTIAPPRSFADWIQQINAKRRELLEEDFLNSIADGFADASRWGTTTIANIESMPALLRRMTPPSLRTWWFYEMIDVQSSVKIEQMLADALSLGEAKADWLGGFGLSPHGPYTASAELSRAAAECAARNDLLLTTHLAESREEMEMFRDGTGPLFELLQCLGRPMDDCGAGKTPLAVMLDRQIMDERWIVVHLNELTKDDFARLERGPRFHIAHCPRSGRYFDHAHFEMRRLRELGFNICLGTDSLASNSSLSLFAEMRAVRDANPWLSAREIFEMATVNGARALQQADDLGKISAGYSADLIALPLEDSKGDIYEKIIDWSEPVTSMLVAGAPVTTA